MSSTLSKRNQARNEKALQELIKTVPGNERCADCQARNPGWASWSLGIFLCMRCAALHRKLGTHVSKVKSLSMDSWSNDQVENMRKVGNASSNKNFNPSNTKPPIPLDVDEVDSAMERFIRQKYEQKSYMAGAAARQPTARVHTGGTGSSDDHPPPPPPKPGRRFGFGLRSSSSALHLSRKTSTSDSVNSPTQNNKQSRIFGASIGVTEEGMEWKLVTLKEMGFPDDKRNSSVLKGLNGDLERAIESLVRLGEGPGAAKVKSPVSSQFSSRRDTPTIPEFQSQPPSAGAFVQKTNASPPRAQNPVSAGHTSSSSYNPFDIGNPLSPTQQSSIDSAFENLNIGQTQAQPLFPNATGGYPQHQEQLQQARLQQSMTPPVPQMPQQFSHNNPYSQPQNYNPFLNSTPQQTQPMPTNPYLPPQQTIGSPNPFLNQTNLHPGLLSPGQISFQQPQQQTWMQQHQQQPQHPQSTQQPTNEPPTQYANAHIYSPQNQAFTSANQTFSPINQTFSPSTQAFSPSAQMFSPQAQMSPNGPQNSTFGHMSPTNQYYSQAQPMYPQATGRVDKSSILALYNLPQLAPQPLTSENGGSSNTSTTASPRPLAAKLPPGLPSGPQRSVTMPVSGNRNPFLSAGGSAAAFNIQQNIALQHANQESLDSGRHSPDAFASLSARFVR